ncbi:MAG: site-specific integrase, partial [Alphaproteobacteria bacterium]
MAARAGAVYAAMVDDNDDAAEGFADRISGADIGLPALVDKLDGFRLRVPAMVALFTGMRLGEILALRWKRVDLEAKEIRVREALEQTKTHGTRFKPAKTRAGRRDITLPDVLIEALWEHRRAALELRMQLGAGR